MSKDLLDLKKKIFRARESHDDFAALSLIQAYERLRLDRIANVFVSLVRSGQATLRDATLDEVLDLKYLGVCVVESSRGCIVRWPKSQNVYRQTASDFLAARAPIQKLRMDQPAVWAGLTRLADEIVTNDYACIHLFGPGADRTRAHFGYEATSGEWNATREFLLKANRDRDRDGDIVNAVFGLSIDTSTVEREGDVQVTPAYEGLVIMAARQMLDLEFDRGGPLPTIRLFVPCEPAMDPFVG